MTDRKLRLGAFVMATGHHIAAWRHPGAEANAGHSLEHWSEHEAADGFNVMPPVLPSSLAEFAELVVPELTRRGLFRSEYEGATLRENLGLARPQNQHTIKREAARTDAA